MLFAVGGSESILGDSMIVAQKAAFYGASAWVFWDPWDAVGKSHGINGHCCGKSHGKLPLKIGDGS
jgi:hypothetical protein